MTRKQKPISLAGLAHEDRSRVPAMLKELEGEPNGNPSSEPRRALRFFSVVVLSEDGTKSAPKKRD